MRASLALQEAGLDLGLGGKIIIITGGGLGIGAAIARASAAEGAIPVIVNPDTPAVQASLDKLREQGRQFGFLPILLTTSDTCRQAVEQTLAQFGRIDALVNNVGFNDNVGLESGTPEAFQHSLDRNLSHYFAMAHYALPALKQSRGSILNIASKVAVTGQGGTSGYAAAKGAQLALTREWAVELAPYGIRVNAIVPSEVDTPAYAEWLKIFEESEVKLAAIVRNIPLGKRMTTPEEIAATAVFLLSAHSSHTTGQHVFVDGGYVHLDRAATAR
jgi:L-fucose dehydrogenase